MSDSNSHELSENIEDTIGPIPRHIQAQIKQQERDSRAALLASSLINEQESFMFDEDDRKQRDVFLSKVFMHAFTSLSAPVVFYYLNRNALRQRSLFFKSAGILSIFAMANGYVVYRAHNNLKETLLNKYPI